MAVATDMSETERMKAERAAKVALEEDRLKLEKEKEAGGGECALCAVRPALVMCVCVCVCVCMCVCVFVCVCVSMRCDVCDILWCPERNENHSLLE